MLTFPGPSSRRASRSRLSILPSIEGRETILDRGTNGLSVEVHRFGASEQAGDVKDEGENWWDTRSFLHVSS